MKIFVKLLKDESGASAIEYGIITALIAVVCIASIAAMSEGTKYTYSQTTDALCDGC